MFDKHYEQLKDRYKELLSVEELNKIFDDCNPKNKKSKSFVYQQKKMHTILWVFSILILTVAITFIYLLNNIKLLCLIQELFQTVLFCIRNT